jgi:hypothetical protein
MKDQKIQDETIQLSVYELTNFLRAMGMFKRKTQEDNIEQVVFSSNPKTEEEITPHVKPTTPENISSGFLRTTVESLKQTPVTQIVGSNSTRQYTSKIAHKKTEIISTTAEPATPLFMLEARSIELNTSYGTALIAPTIGSSMSHTPFFVFNEKQMFFFNLFFTMATFFFVIMLLIISTIFVFFFF